MKRPQVQSIDFSITIRCLAALRRFQDMEEQTARRRFQDTEEQEQGRPGQDTVFTVFTV